MQVCEMTRTGHLVGRDLSNKFCFWKSHLSTWRRLIYINAAKNNVATMRRPVQQRSQSNETIAHDREQSAWTSPLHVACAAGNALLAERLLEADVDIEAKDQFGGMRPLHVACFCEAEAFVELLVKRGADVKVKPQEAWTPLHCVAHSESSVTVAELLLTAAAALDAKDEVKQALARLFWTPKMRSLGLSIVFFRAVGHRFTWRPCTTRAWQSYASAWEQMSTQRFRIAGTSTAHRCISHRAARWS
eukprot:TRINITY_DN11715_c0_g1_i13.p1 TRINITY_DN11715_c0_g1~~TRINITY_DN11715_c0_g1_i13.p1  ORF type:complete len:246 (+),score=14.59 TRINITY_DN11715_c0_g1_i13:256-993(+)